MWPARGGARAGSARAGGYSGMLRGLKVRTGRTWWATGGSDLAPDTRFGGGLAEVLAHRCAGWRVNGEASARDEARRALHTVGRTSRQTPSHRAAGGHQRRTPSRAIFERRFCWPLSRVRALGPAPPTIIPPKRRAQSAQRAGAARSRAQAARAALFRSFARSSSFDSLSGVVCVASMGMGVHDGLVEGGRGTRINHLHHTSQSAPRPLAPPWPRQTPGCP
jgi:hypothetical protein